MNKLIGTICHVNVVRTVGSAECMNCLFHNDSYHETKNHIFCVFPEEEEKDDK